MLRQCFLLIFLYTGVCQAQQMRVSQLGLAAPGIQNCTPVKDQYLSATCWSFSSNSFLESELQKKGKGKTDLSEMFISRYSMRRKIEMHLQLKGKNFFTPGGQFHDVVWVIKHYGMAPEEAYTGLPEGKVNHDHGDMDTLLSHFVNDCVAKGITVLDKRQLAFLDSVQDQYMGKVPRNFIYKGKAYTPLSFAKEYLGLNMDDYIEITSYTHHPFYQQFILEDKYNWTSDAYYNVPLNDFSAITDSALKNGYTIGWDGDAMDDYFKYYDGLAWLPGPVNDYQQYRQQAFEDQTTLLDHMMHIVGVTTDNTGRKWYYVKNSWGDYSNSLGGFLFMRDDYFMIRTVAIIVSKKAIPPAIRRKMGIL
jgi:bleomycin hydrolase